MAYNEFTQKHKDGKDVYTLDQFDRDNMSATPAFFRPIDVWRQWINGLTEPDYKKFDRQLNQLLTWANERFEKGW